MPKVQFIGDRIEFNGFLVARMTASGAASIKSDFKQYVEGADQRSYDRGYAAGRNDEKNFQMDDH